jgi:hypothetical protein
MSDTTSDNKGLVTITFEEYNDLLEDQRMLDALMACGVDNWQGWDEAMEMMSKIEEGLM